MSSLSRWILALAIALSLVIVVRASQQQEYYLPLAYRQPTLTPTPTGTATRTPTVTPTATRTPTPLAGLKITDILYAPAGNPLDEWIAIQNTDSRTAQLKGATLISESGNKWTFPSFELRSGRHVTVWTRSGSNNDSNLYMGRHEPFWNDVLDCAILRDVLKNKLDRFCYSQGVFFEP